MVAGLINGFPRQAIEHKGGSAFSEYAVFAKELEIELVLEVLHRLVH